MINIKITKALDKPKFSDIGNGFFIYQDILFLKHRNNNAIKMTTLEEVHFPVDLLVKPVTVNIEAICSS